MQASNPVYTSEMRFGVVMYGGVSLAIYINGVSNELFELCCATPKDGGKRLEAGSSRAVYRKLSWLLANPELREAARRHASGEGPDPFDGSDPKDASLRSEQQRFVVDVIAGTSAGGINGVFLAKALAGGQPFSPLQQMWIDEGDMALLLNDAQSVEKLPLPKPTQPTSLLNSDRMYLKLLEAMERMDAAPAVLPHGPGGSSPLVDEVDLFVTTTDIEGAIVPIRLFDKVVYERRHRQVFQFRYAASGGQPRVNNFAPKDSGFLAFAARCTSSFPFAFEPMSLQDAERLCGLRVGGAGVSFDGHKAFFKGLSADDLAGSRWKQRAFGDGGYLDNKPFSFVVEALSRRQAVLPIERKLIYVEPAPAHPELEAQQAGKPNALQNAVAALTHIPQYETIREDLEAVLKRNRRIERIERMVRMIEWDVESHPEDPFAKVLAVKGQVRDWSQLDLGDMLEYYGPAFLPYRRLRLNTVTDEITQLLGARWGVDPDSDLQYSLRALVRAWREERYFEHAEQAKPGQTASINAFLGAYDRSYRRRRAAFLLRKSKQLMLMLPRVEGLLAGTTKATESEAPLLKRLRRHAGEGVALNGARLHAALLALRQGLAESLGALRDIQAERTHDEPACRQLEALLGLLLGELPGAQALTELPGVQGGMVKVAAAELPAPSSTRTLQQNVFERAVSLFAKAREGQRTQLQALLEADLEAIRLESNDGVSQLRELLGQPALAAELSLEKDANGKEVERQRIVVSVEDVRADWPQAAVLNTLEGEVLRKLLAEYRSRFDEFDQVSFPLYYDTGTGEPSTVEVVRVSPEDAPSLVAHRDAADREKLAGTALFNFGAFLDANWRRNDILWGRLDGCERLLAALLPSADDNRLREQLLQEGQRAILREGLAPEAYDELVQRFAGALKASKESNVEAAFGALWEGLGTDDAARHSRLAMALRAVLGDEGLHAWMRDHYRVDRELPPAPTMQTAARAITITGRLLQGIEQTQRSQGQRAIWLTRTGLALQGLLSLSAPGSMAATVARHWMLRVHVFAALLFFGGLLLSVPTARNFGLGVFAVTLALHLVLLIAGDAQHKRWGWLKFGVGLLLAGVLGLAAIGLWSLLRLGWRALLP